MLCPYYDIGNIGIGPMAMLPAGAGCMQHSKGDIVCMDDYQGYYYILVVVQDEKECLCGVVATQYDSDNDWFYLDLPRINEFAEQGRLCYMGFQMELVDNKLQFAFNKMDSETKGVILSEIDDVMDSYNHITKFQLKNMQKLMEDSTIALAGFDEERGVAFRGIILMHGEALETVRQVLEDEGYRGVGLGIRRSTRQGHIRFFTIEGVREGIAEIFSTEWQDVSRIINAYKKVGVPFVFDHLCVNIQDGLLADMVASIL
jgi:hypothetical protein